VSKKKIDWPSFKIIKCYSYRDKENVLRHETVRAKDKNHPKLFLQRQPKSGIKAPDDDNKNHWLWNLKGVTVLPYRLPELIKGKDPVFLFEGEKDVDNAREKLGITASTNPMGSGKWPKFSKQLNPWFKDRELFIIPDNDKQGEKHLEQVANSLQGIAKSIKILRLPEAKDLSDWIQIEGNTEEKFLTLKFEAKEWKPKSNLVLRGPERKKEKKLKIVYITETLVDRLVHLVKSEKGQVLYLLLDEKGKLEIVPHIESYDEDEEGNTILIRRIPKQDLPIKYVDESILKIKQKDLNFKDLFDEIVKFIKSYVELPEEEQYLLLAFWVFHSYLIEKNDTTPILYFYGVKITGKTRAGEVLEEIAYKCERLTTPTEATMFRTAEYFKTALIVDELKLWGKDANEAIATLLKSRYKRGIKVSRCNMLKSGERMIEYFDVFGPTIICSTESVPDTLESRCILFLMQKNINPTVEKKIDKKWAAELRKKLTLFRVKYFDTKLPEAELIARRRLQEILGPLQQVQQLIKPEGITNLKKIARTLEEETKEEEASGEDAEVVENIKYYHRIEEDKYFLTTELTERINEGKTDEEKWKTRKTAFRAKRLGFKRMRTPAGHRGFKTDKELLKKLLERFSIEQKNPDT